MQGPPEISTSYLTKSYVFFDRALICVSKTCLKFFDIFCLTKKLTVIYCFKKRINTKIDLLLFNNKIVKQFIKMQLSFGNLMIAEGGAKQDIL